MFVSVESCESCGDVECWKLCCTRWTVEDEKEKNRRARVGRDFSVVGEKSGRWSSGFGGWKRRKEGVEYEGGEGCGENGGGGCDLYSTYFRILSTYEDGRRARRTEGKRGKEVSVPSSYLTFKDGKKGEISVEKSEETSHWTFTRDSTSKRQER